MKHFSVLKGIDDVLITSKFIPTLSASTRCVSYDLTRLITQKSSCGETRHLYLSFLHLWTRGVCARGRPSHSPTVLISGLMDLRLCFWERQALVGALTAGDGGNKASLWLRIWDWDQTSFSQDHTAEATVTFITFHVMSPSLFHSFPPTFIHTALLFCHCWSSAPLSPPPSRHPLSRWHCYPRHLRDKVTPDERWRTCTQERAAICADTDELRAFLQSSRLFVHNRIRLEQSCYGVLHKDLVNIKEASVL